MRTVFVSYSRNNLEAVSQLVRDLQDVGFNAWHDQTLTGGQRWWELKLSSVSEEELCAIEEFFVSQQGRFGRFTFVDPFDGTEYPNCSFDADSLHGQLFDEESAQSTLIIRMNL